MSRIVFAPTKGRGVDSDLVIWLMNHFINTTVDLKVGTFGQDVVVCDGPEPEIRSIEKLIGTTPEFRVFYI